MKDFILKYQKIENALHSLRDAGYDLTDDVYLALIKERAILEKNYNKERKEKNLL